MNPHGVLTEDSIPEVEQGSGTGNREVEVEPEVQDQIPRQAAPAKRKNPDLYIDDHQQGLLHRLWQQRPDWVGQLTYPGFVKLMKEHGVRATNDALEDLIEHAGQVERPYPYLAKIAAESHSVANQ